MPNLYRLLLPFSFSINLFKKPTEVAPRPKNKTNKTKLFAMPSPIYGRELGIKSKMLTINMTERDKLKANDKNSSFFFTGINIPKQPSIVEKPAILAKIKGHKISI